MNYKDSIGDAVKSCRLEHGLSQVDLEKKTGLLRDHISRIENGVTTPSLGLSVPA